MALCCPVAPPSVALNRACPPSEVLKSPSYLPGIHLRIEAVDVASVKGYALTMEKNDAPRPGELLPDVTLTSAEGHELRLSDFRGRSNLVVVFAGGMDRKDVVNLVASAASKHTDLASEEAELIVILTKNRAGQTPSVLRADWPFIILIDSDLNAHLLFDTLDESGRVVPAVFVVDRYGEIFAHYHGAGQHGLPGIDEVLQWLFFINSQCPECGVPDSPG